MVTKKVAVLVAVAALAGCADAPAPQAPVEPARLVTLPIADFTADITAPSRLGLGATPGNAVWTVTWPATGGGIAYNPARSIQLRSLQNFAIDETDVGACARSIWAPVRIENFFPERLGRVYVAFNWTGGSDHAMCAPESPPGPSVGSVFSNPPVVGPFGNLVYASNVDPPGIDLPEWYAASNQIVNSDACPGCVPAGGGSTRDWRFAYPAGGGFRVAGRVYAELHPQPPTVTIPSDDDFGLIEQVPFGVYVYDTNDGEQRPWVTQLKVEVCPGTESGCTPPNVLQTYYLGSPTHSSTPHRSDFVLTQQAANLTLGVQHYMKVTNVWDVDGEGLAAGGPGGTVEGSVSLVKSFTPVGTPVPLTADGIGFGDGDELVWSIDTPDPVAIPPSVWGGPTMQICDTAVLPTDGSCPGTLLYAPLTASGYWNRDITHTLNGSVVTYTWQPDYAVWSGPQSSANQFPRPPNGTVGYWRLRNLYSDSGGRAGRWSLTRKVVFGERPTALAQNGTSHALSFTVDAQATGGQVDLCHNEGCTCAGEGCNPYLAQGLAATGTLPNLSVDPLPHASGAFHWRARATYGTPSTNGGPWTATQSAVNP